MTGLRLADSLHSVHSNSWNDCQCGSAPTAATALILRQSIFGTSSTPIATTSRGTAVPIGSAATALTQAKHAERLHMLAFPAPQRTGHLPGETHGSVARPKATLEHGYCKMATCRKRAGCRECLHTGWGQPSQLLLSIAASTTPDPEHGWVVGRFRRRTLARRCTPRSPTYRCRARWSRSLRCGATGCRRG